MPLAKNRSLPATGSTVPVAEAPTITTDDSALKPSTGATPSVIKELRDKKEEYDSQFNTDFIQPLVDDIKELSSEYKKISKSSAFNNIILKSSRGGFDVLWKWYNSNAGTQSERSLLAKYFLLWSEAKEKNDLLKAIKETEQLWSAYIVGNSEKNFIETDIQKTFNGIEVWSLENSQFIKRYATKKYSSNMNQVKSYVEKNKDFLIDYWKYYTNKSS